MSDIENEEIYTLATSLHRTVPEGTCGGTVVAALVVLLGAGINWAPEAIQDELLEKSISTLRGIVADKDVRFEP